MKNYDIIQVEYDPFGIAWITNGLDDIEIETKGVKQKDLEEVVTGLQLKLEQFDPDDEIPNKLQFNDSNGKLYEATFGENCLIDRI